MTASTYYEKHETAWRNAVDRLTDRFAQPDTDRDALTADLHRLVDTALNSTNTTWEPGHPCPECGDPELFRWVSMAELARHENGYTEIQDVDNHSTVFAWECGACETAIAVSPAGILLPVLDCEEPDGLTELHTALAAALPSTDWRSGTACTACNSHFIGEQPVDVEPVTSQDGMQEFYSTSERITTVEYWCDSCGDTLRQSEAGILMKPFSL